MATRSRIGMECTDAFGNKFVKSIYCHWDGYPEGVGATLQKHYLDREKVAALIELGAISSLEKEVAPTGPHSFDRPQPGVVVAYHRDRGEDPIDPRVDASVSDFFNSDIEQYGYLFTDEGEWLVKGDGDPVPLPYVLSGTVFIN
jgi:hypothetical protein